MAEALALQGAKWVASTIIDSLLKEGFSYLDVDVSIKLQYLETTILPQFQLMIKAAERSNEQKSKVELWVRKLKDALYKVEDTLDSYKYQLLKKNVSYLNTHYALKRFKKVARKVTDKLSNLSPLRIKLRRSLNKLEEAIAEAMKIYKQMQIEDNMAAHDLRIQEEPNVTTSLLPYEIDGRNAERDMIIDKYLLDQSEASKAGKNYSIYHIVGIGGAGKTTLAQFIYSDERIVNHFDIRMWVYMSHNLDISKHTWEMIESASNNKCSHHDNLDTPQNQLINLIKSKKVFLVLDDVWCDKTINEKEWEDFLAPLVVAGKKGSKILVTTRILNLPLALHPQYSMLLKDLSEDVIVSLLMYHAFGNAKLIDMHLQTELKDIGRQIGQKLYGSPLAAKVVGDQLSKRLEVNFWKAALARDNLHDTQQVLLWNYQRLDVPVQRCFSYFSLFPKGYNFKAEKMVRLWIAEGFINSSNNSMRMEDIGKSYLDELVSGSFLQFDNNMKIYTMFNLLHDLAEKFSKKDILRIENDEVKEIPPTIRYLYISNGSLWENNMSFDKLENIRTLIINGSVSYSVIDKLFAVIQKYNKLRVLDLSGMGMVSDKFYHLPKSIGDLKHLYYLDLYGTAVNELPVVLDKLYHLKVLIAPYLTVSLPRSLKNLINLRHFEGDTEALTRIPEIGRRLTFLQTSLEFHIKKEKGYDIDQLSDLKELRGSLIISNLENVQGKDKAVEANLKDKEHLESLHLTWGDNIENDSRRDLDREVLEGLQPHPNLTNLSIEGYRSPTYPSWLLQEGCLPNLRSLKFKNCTSLSDLLYRSSLSDRKLPQSLKELVISDCRSLVFVSDEELERPKDILGEAEKIDEERLKDIFLGQEKTKFILPSGLQSLKIKYCDIKYGALSQSLERLTTLTSLELCGISTISTLPSEEVLGHLVALTHLQITFCRRLKSLGGLYALPSLKDLAIDTCSCLELEMVMSSEGGGGGRILPHSLQSLNIAGCGSMKSFVIDEDLPNLGIVRVLNCLSLASLSLSQLTALVELEIKHCPCISLLSDLPMSLQSLQLDGSSGMSPFPVRLPESLSSLELWNCPDILSLPDLPESLNFIRIFGCPILKERCQSPNGEDWPKIAHIPKKFIW